MEKTNINKTLFISDLDGTLLNSKAELSSETIDILNMLIEQGVLFTYATARSWLGAHRITKPIKLTIPVITYNGTFIADAKTGALENTFVFTSNERNEIINKCVEFGIFPLIYALVEGTEKVLWVKGSENNAVNNYLHNRTGDPRLLSVESAEKLKIGDSFYITCIGEKDELLSLVEYYRNKGQYTVNFQNDIYNTDEYWFEIYPKNADKGKSVLFLMEKLDLNRCICFGDNLNDLPMFAIADECYAVSNAVDELKNIATGIIGNNNENSVANWIFDIVKSGDNL